MINTSSFLYSAIKEQISEGNMVTLNVTGRSMRPFLKGNGNESVIVSRYTPDELKAGIIIIFLYNNRLFSHRIVTKRNEIFIAQGDGICIDTEEIKQGNILAVVRNVIRGGKKKSSPYCFSARVYWCLWYKLRPVRRYLLSIYNRLYK